jgi:hypothetical protein
MGIVSTLGLGKETVLCSIFGSEKGVSVDQPQRYVPAIGSNGFPEETPASN